jgi:CDP-diacylglycerol pyrophosphatase
MGENDEQNDQVRRGRKTAWLLLAAAGLVTMTAIATFAVGLDRQALWQVVRGCVADFKLTSAPFPCLAVNLSGGEERGHVVLRPPLMHDMIVSPTRKVAGIENPFLQSPDAPNYFDAAWRARSLLKGAERRRPNRDEVALVVNSAINRTQDQLHIHVGCLLPSVQRALAAAAPDVPIGEWKQLTAVISHIVFWGTRVRGTDLAAVHPFRLVAEAFAERVRDEGNLTIMVAAVRVDGDEGFLILASYVGAPHSWWAVGNEDLLDPRCPTDLSLNG